MHVVEGERMSTFIQNDISIALRRHSAAIYCFNKALFLVYAITTRFGDRLVPFPIPSVTELPVLADDALPSFLIHLGIIDLSQSKQCRLFPLASSIDLDEVTHSNHEQPTASAPAFSDGPPLSVADAYALRAAAIDACAVIVSEARSLSSELDSTNGWLTSIKAFELSRCLRLLARERAAYKVLPGLTLRNTLFF
jgi:hypothetical protein